jgi:hypothetical protein
VADLDDRPDHAAAAGSSDLARCLENHQPGCNLQHQQGDLLLASTNTTSTTSTSGARNSSNDTVTIRRISNTATDNIVNPRRRNRQHQESGYNNSNFSLGEEGLQHQQRLGPPCYTLDRQIKSSIAQLTSAREFLNSVELRLSSLQDDKNNRVTPPVTEERIKLTPQKEYYTVGGESYRKLEFSHIKCISEIRDLALELLKPVEHMEYKFLENLEGNESTTAQAHQQQHQEVVSRSDGTIRRSLTNVRKTKYKDVIPTKLNNLRLFNLQECKNFEGCCPCKMRLRDAKRSRFKGGVGNFAEMLPTPIPMNALQKKSKVFHKRKMNSIKETTKILAKDYFFAQQTAKKNVVGEEESILTKGIVHGLIVEDSRSEGSNVSLPLEDRHWKGMIETIEKAFNFQLVGGRVKREEEDEDETLDANSNSSNNGGKKRKQITSTNLSIPTKLRKLPIEYTKEFKERRLVPCPCKVSINGCCLTRNAVKGAAAEKADTLFPAVVERQQ